MVIRFGPAGLGGVKTALETLEQYNKLGFRACEIAFTYNAYIKNKEDAEAIGKKAKELDIALSIHAPYYINLNSSDKGKREASIKRILECCKIGSWLEAKRIVFHPGYYSEDKEESYQNIKNGIIEILKEIKRNNFNIEIAAETMGKVNVFGSVDEINRLVEETGCGFCIDFAHILARDKRVDYGKLLKLFPQEKWHCHFSGIVYGDKGEKHHKTTEKSEWLGLLNNLPRNKEIIIINESPTMVDDCIEGIKVLNSLRQ